MRVSLGGLGERKVTQCQRGCPGDRMPSRALLQLLEEGGKWQLQVTSRCGPHNLPGLPLAALGIAKASPVPCQQSLP